MACVNNGTISIRKGNNYFIRNEKNHVDWDKIRRNNILFIYGDNLHYDIVESKLETVTEQFVIKAKQPVQFNYCLEISGQNQDYFFNGDTLQILLGDTKISKTISSINRESNCAEILLDTPLFNSSGQVILEGTGFLVTTKNKVFINSFYLNYSLYDTPYHISQSFTKNLNLPLMEITNSAFGPTAALYNRGVKLMDEAFEHTHLNLPNSLFQTIKIEGGNKVRDIPINPPLLYTPIVFGQLQNNVTKEQNDSSFRIFDVSPTGYKLEINDNITESFWDFNAILLPNYTNYQALFSNFKSSEVIVSPIQKGFFTFSREKFVNGSYIINLSSSFKYRLTNIACKTKEGFAQVKFQINENVIEEPVITANPNVFKSYLPVIVISEGDSLSVKLENITNVRDLDMTIEYEKV